jgi:cytoskeletal protein RodZ
VWKVVLAGGTISSMRTVGKILREARVDKLLSLDEVEKHTKIRKELLEALESDNYDKLPPSTFVQGFIKNYAKYLGLDQGKLLAVFRRDYESSKHPDVVLESLSNPLKEKKFFLTPSRLLGLVIVLVVVGFFAYLWVEYRQFVGAPALEVKSPTDQQTVEIPTVVVEGKTDPEAKVTVNNTDVGLDKGGNFKEEIKLSSSVNTVEVISTSKFGQTAKIDRTVFVRK